MTKKYSLPIGDEWAFWTSFFHAVADAPWTSGTIGTWVRTWLFASV